MDCYKIVTPNFWTAKQTVIKLPVSVDGVNFRFTYPNQINHKLKTNMKLKSLLIGASALGFAASAQAQTQTTVINITGATAFRSAAHAAIMASFNQSGALGTTWNYAHNNTTGNGGSAGRAIYRGTFPGISGTTVIRTSWTGSVEGVRALTKPTLVPETYLTNSDTNFPVSASGEKPGASATETSTVHAFAFADMAQAAAPTAYRSPKLNGGPIGVIAFLPVINKDADASITNITINQFRRLVSHGTIPASMLTGNASSNGTIYNVQRNDGSGTRVIHLAEIGHGQANLTKGYVFGNFTLASTPLLAPQTGNLSVFGVSSGSNRVAFSNDYRSTSVEGNGGYVSGGSIADLMRMTSGFNGNIISWLGTSDAVRALNISNGNITGGRVLSYNGERLDGVAAGALNAADKNKIALGKYSGWSFEQLFYVGTLSGARKTVYDKLVSVIPANLGTAGCSMAEMQVIRPTDGGVIAPK
jgi:hypothetical protein